MNNKGLINLCIALLVFSSAFAQDSTLVKKEPWYRPDYATIQFAGNIGFISLGIGYQFFNNRINSEILYGFVPASISKTENINTITFKNTFPITNKKHKTITTTLITGFAVSYETGNNSFVKLPDKYPDDYYRTNAFHSTFFIGAKAHKDFTDTIIIKGIDFYSEIGTVDTYLWYAMSQKINPTKIFSLSVGVNLYF